MTIKHSSLDVYFHMKNHYKKLRLAKSVLDTHTGPSAGTKSRVRSSSPKSLVENQFLAIPTARQRRPASGEELNPKRLEKSKRTRYPYHSALLAKHDCRPSSSSSVDPAITRNPSDTTDPIQTRDWGRDSREQEITHETDSSERQNFSFKPPLDSNTDTSSVEAVIVEPTAPESKDEIAEKHNNCDRDGMFQEKLNTAGSFVLEIIEEETSNKQPSRNSKASEKHESSDKSSNETGDDRPKEKSSCDERKQYTFASVFQYEYLQFSLRITEDIIRSDLYDDTEMKRVFRSHIEANRGRLDVEKMKEQIKDLCAELNISCDDCPRPTSCREDTWDNLSPSSPYFIEPTSESFKSDLRTLAQGSGSREQTKSTSTPYSVERPYQTAPVVQVAEIHNSSTSNRNSSGVKDDSECTISNNSAAKKELCDLNNPERHSPVRDSDEKRNTEKYFSHSSPNRTLHQGKENLTTTVVCTEQAVQLPTSEIDVRTTNPAPVESPEESSDVIQIQTTLKAFSETEPSKYVQVDRGQMTVLSLSESGEEDEQLNFTKPLRKDAPTSDGTSKYLNFELLGEARTNHHRSTSDSSSHKLYRSEIDAPSTFTSAPLLHETRTRCEAPPQKKNDDYVIVSCPVFLPVHVTNCDRAPEAKLKFFDTTEKYNVNDLSQTCSEQQKVMDRSNLLLTDCYNNSARPRQFFPTLFTHTNASGFFSIEEPVLHQSEPLVRCRASVVSTNNLRTCSRSDEFIQPRMKQPIISPDESTSFTLFSDVGVRPGSE